MQLHNDPLHIINLNNNQMIHLADVPDDGTKLLASLMARTVSGPLPIPKLGLVEIEADYGEGAAVFNLRIDGKAACWATFESGSPHAEQNWREAHAFHRSLLNRCRRPQSCLTRSPMPEGSWLALTFFPRCLTVLSADQILLAVSALWGVTWELRRSEWLAFDQNPDGRVFPNSATKTN